VLDRVAGRSDQHPHAWAWRSQVPRRSPAGSGSGAVTSGALRCRRPSAATLTAPARQAAAPAAPPAGPAGAGRPVLTAQCLPAGPDRVQRVALGAGPASRPLGRSTSTTHSPRSARSMPARHRSSRSPPTPSSGGPARVMQPTQAWLWQRPPPGPAGR
jgi:hypothetical protein